MMGAERENQKDVLLSNVFSIWVVLLASLAPCTSRYWYGGSRKISLPAFTYRYVPHTRDNVSASSFSIFLLITPLLTAGFI